MAADDDDGPVAMHDAAMTNEGDEDLYSVKCVSDLKALDRTMVDHGRAGAVDHLPREQTEALDKHTKERAQPPLQAAVGGPLVFGGALPSTIG